MEAVRMLLFGPGPGPGGRRPGPLPPQAQAQAQVLAAEQEQVISIPMPAVAIVPRTQPQQRLPPPPAPPSIPPPPSRTGEDAELPFVAPTATAAAAAAAAESGSEQEEEVEYESEQGEDDDDDDEEEEKVSAHIAKHFEQIRQVGNGVLVCVPADGAPVMFIRKDTAFHAFCELAQKVRVHHAQLLFQARPAFQQLFSDRYRQAGKQSWGYVQQLLQPNSSNSSTTTTNSSPNGSVSMADVVVAYSAPGAEDNGAGTRAGAAAAAEPDPFPAWDETHALFLLPMYYIFQAIGEIELGLYGGALADAIRRGDLTGARQLLDRQKPHLEERAHARMLTQELRMVGTRLRRAILENPGGAASTEEVRMLATQMADLEQRLAAVELKHGEGLTADVNNNKSRLFF